MNAIIVIPTYNEKDNIQPLVKEIFKAAPDIRILIIDDNSPDGTGRVADELSKEYKQIKVLHREKKEGLGRAYLAGFKEALKMNPDYILQMDADFSHDPKYIPLFLKEIASFDIVLGSRFLNTKRPPRVSSFSCWASSYVRWITGMKFTDCLGGFKGYRRNVLRALELDKFISTGFIFQAEFLYRAFKKRFSIREIPIVFYPRKSGLSKRSKRIILEALFKILLFRLS
jgi:dolichol-phosphate mannosyltransferase